MSHAPAPWAALPCERRLGEQLPQGGRGRGGRCLWDPLSWPRQASPPPKWAPDPPPITTRFSSGLHVLGLHLNTHSPTICLGLSEDQWGSQGPAQQGAAGKSLTRAKKANRDQSLGLDSCWGSPWKAGLPTGETRLLLCTGV